MKPKVLALILGMGLFLAGCSGLGGPAVMANFEGGQIGFEVDDEGTIVIMQSLVTFVNGAGEPPKTITGFEARVTNRAGDLIPGLDDHLYNEDGLAIELPAGIVCAEDVAQCNMFNGVPRSQAAEPVNLMLLQGQIAAEMVLTSHYPLHADVTFTGYEGGRKFTFRSRLTITNPFGEGQ